MWRCTKTSVHRYRVGFGAWNIHGGVELQALGDTTKAFNGGDGHRFIVSGGLGFSY